MNLIEIYLKPRVKALLDEAIGQRGEHWLERLAAATFDLEDWHEVTPEQRKATKRMFFAYIYGASSYKLSLMFASSPITMKGAVIAIDSFRENFPDIKFEKINLEQTKPPSRGVVVSSKTGASWPKPKHSY